MVLIIMIILQPWYILSTLIFSRRKVRLMSGCPVVSPSLLEQHIEKKPSEIISEEEVKCDFVW